MAVRHNARLCLWILSLIWCCNLCCSAVFFPTNSAYGIFAAIAVPLELPHRNVFISYNFEANYNLPYTWDLPPIANGLEDEDLLVQARDFRHMNQTDGCTNCTLEIENEITTTTPTLNTTSHVREEPATRRRRQPKSVVNSLLTRTHFYHILMDKFKRSGYNAEPCLLRLICETNSSGLGEVNGVLGSLVHIIFSFCFAMTFSPSTSAHENLPLSYYQAEVDGSDGFCEDYVADCQENPLDLISAPLGDIIDDLMNSK
ncbi:uncharacterized protein LOC105221495 isoform X1 [Zeugodacus cucurbitae]|uniref:uncharacterized protein LOC105221495 isoform X1 n=1 Tax=Zeugodacus cucurbitae TaxID=28588 RepID=UPI0023D8EA1B|nr:uncharacterized protein LOC105221495 isoform X1 [Zeugodacus cucurbitae]